MSSVLLTICILLQLMFQYDCFSPEDTKARMEDKAVLSVSLKDIEDFVENNENIKNTKPSFLVIQKKMKNYEKLGTGESLYTDDAYSGVVEDHHKQFVQPNKFETRNKNDDYIYKDDQSKFTSEFPSHELKAEGSSNMNMFEALAMKVIGENPIYFKHEILPTYDFSETQLIPSYRPRFDYDSYARDSTAEKLQGKKYWHEPDDIGRRQGVSDSKGCRTVVKKIRDSDKVKSSTDDAAVKGVVITKECEYPSGNGPDATILGVHDEYKSLNPHDPEYPRETIGKSYVDEDNPAPALHSYRKDIDYTQPSFTKPSDESDPNNYSEKHLKSDYIDKMLESHFKSFPTFRNPMSSLKNIQDRFRKHKNINLQTNQKPIYHEYHHDHSYPKSSSDDEQISKSTRSQTEDEPKIIHHQHHYHHYPEQHESTARPNSETLHHKNKQHDTTPDSRYKGGSDSENDPTRPKMMKKSFAYYRKENPKDDPDNQQYAEEYSQGNYRSFSSDYDSDRDGPK